MEGNTRQSGWQRSEDPCRYFQTELGLNPMLMACLKNLGPFSEQPRQKQTPNQCVIAYVMMLIAIGYEFRSEKRRKNSSSSPSRSHPSTRSLL